MNRHPALDSAAHRSLFALLERDSGVDFRAYRPAMVDRRIEHRIRLSQATGLAEYAATLEHDPAELARLIDAILIKTTSMFRGAAAFTALRQRVLPGLFARRAAEGARSLRAWVVGWSTGEEAWWSVLFLGSSEALSEQVLREFVPLVPSAPIYARR